MPLTEEHRTPWHLLSIKLIYTSSTQSILRSLSLARWLTKHPFWCSDALAFFFFSAKRQSLLSTITEGIFRHVYESLSLSFAFPSWSKRDVIRVSDKKREWWFASRNENIERWEWCVALSSTNHSKGSKEEVWLRMKSKQKRNRADIQTMGWREQYRRVGHIDPFSRLLQHGSPSYEIDRSDCDEDRERDRQTICCWSTHIRWDLCFQAIDLVLYIAGHPAEIDQLGRGW